VRDAVIVHGEAAYASHVMFRDALYDHVPHEREIGMHIGFLYGALAETRAVYCDYGVSVGMREGIAQRPAGQVVVYRYLNRMRARYCARCAVMVPPDQLLCGGIRCAAIAAGKDGVIV
jgi:hypothetical protein